MKELMRLTVSTKWKEPISILGVVTEETSSSAPQVTTAAETVVVAKEAAVKPLKIEVHATAMHHEQLVPKVAHSQTHEFGHNQAVSFRHIQRNGSL